MSEKSKKPPETEHERQALEKRKQRYQRIDRLQKFSERMSMGQGALTPPGGAKRKQKESADKASAAQPRAGEQSQSGALTRSTGNQTRAARPGDKPAAPIKTGTNAAGKAGEGAAKKAGEGAAKKAGEGAAKKALGGVAGAGAGMASSKQDLSKALQEGDKDEVKKQAVKMLASAFIPGVDKASKIPGVGKLVDKAIGEYAKKLNIWTYLASLLLPVLVFFGPIFGVAMLIPSLGQSTTSKTSDSVTSYAAEDDVETEVQDDIASCTTNGQSTKTEDSNDECAEVTVDASNATSSDSGEEVATGTRAEIVEYAKSLLGTPYKWGGNSPEEGGMDCSGYMVYVFKHFNISLPRTAEEMRDSGRSISQSELQPGDLVVWKAPKGHVAMYVGNNQIVEEPRPGKSAQLVGMRELDAVIFRNVID